MSSYAISTNQMSLCKVLASTLWKLYSCETNGYEPPPFRFCAFKALESGVGLIFTETLREAQISDAAAFTGTSAEITSFIFGCDAIDSHCLGTGT